MALSAAYGGALQWSKIYIFVDPKQISVVFNTEMKKKERKEKRSSAPSAVMLMWPST